jgi:transposase
VVVVPVESGAGSGHGRGPETAAPAARAELRAAEGSWRYRSALPRGIDYRAATAQMRDLDAAERRYQLAVHHARAAPPSSEPGRRARRTCCARDKAYSDRATRALLCARGIPAVIQPADQARHRKNRGSCGDRPVNYDREDYKGRNTVKRAFNQLKSWRGVATRYDKHALAYRGGLLLRPLVL